MWITAAALLFLQAANPSAEGLKALEEGKYEAAADAFTRAIAADPGDYTGHFNLALAYSFLHQDERGIAEYRKTLELHPGVYEAQLNLGILLLRQKNAADARAPLEAAVAQKPAEYRPRYYLAEAELGTGDVVKAEADYRTAIGINDKAAGAHLGLAHALAQQNKLADAAPEFRRAAELDANYRDGLLDLAALYENGGQRADAIEIYRQFPENTAAQERLGSLLLDTQKYADAIPRLEEAYAKSPTEANRLGLAEALLFNNQLDKATPLLEKAAAEDPGNYEVRMMYARALRDQKQYMAAAQQFQEALKLKPNAAAAWSDLGTVLYLAEDYPGALAAFEQARKAGEDTAGNAFLRAIILDKQHVLKPAIEAYQQFLAKTDGKSPNQEWQARQRVKLLEKELERK